MARSLLLLLLALSWCSSSTTTTARQTPSGSATGTASYIRTSCSGTEYPALCVATLSPYAATVGGSPARLAWAALTVSLGGARNASAALRDMAGEPRMAPPAAKAARDCVKMLGDAVDMLRQSVEAMAGIGRAANVRFQVDNVRTWASAALTDYDMCIEGFRAEPAGGGGAREVVHGHVSRVVHLTANALGIVNGMSKQYP